MRRRLVEVPAVAGALGYGWLAARTHPFTAAAETLTAVPFAVLFPVMVRTFVAGRATGRATVGGAEPQGGHRRVAAGAGDGALWPWVVAVALLAAWELVTYAAGVAGGRRPFPTLSSLYDSAARSHVGKALLFASWLALGWGLVRR